MPRRVDPSNVDIIALAKQAKAKGNDDPERIARRLLEIIARNQGYTANRERQDRDNAYDTILREDNEFLAIAIVLLESTM